MALPSLIGIPVELRFIIYDFILGTDHPPSLLRLASVCWKLRRESLPVWLNHHQFDFGIDLPYFETWINVGLPDHLREITKLALRPSVLPWMNYASEVTRIDSHKTGAPPVTIKSLYHEIIDPYLTAVTAGSSCSSPSDRFFSDIARILHIFDPSNNVPHRDSPYLTLFACLRRLPNLSHLMVDMAALPSLSADREMACFTVAASLSKTLTHLDAFTNTYLDLVFLRCLTNLRHFGWAGYARHGSKGTYDILRSLPALESHAIVNPSRCYLYLRRGLKDPCFKAQVLERLQPLKAIWFLDPSLSPRDFEVLTPELIKAVSHHKHSLRHFSIEHARFMPNDRCNAAVALLQSLLTDYPNIRNVHVNLAMLPGTWPGEDKWIAEAKSRGWHVRFRHSEDSVLH
ncbi:hypothetical protein EJ04DRAFT_563451 [Polyplosphaeria fusca]|uniref:Uncharacterized protein n=1 Tax=Polyplosphaeria fusca TaxID=682080 RepID=A0A9P4QX19_9PLEO|nr:hypothetical protein EJ04DRAFT_563451 [Polyplosphaeria fusca]